METPAPQPAAPEAPIAPVSEVNQPLSPVAPNPPEGYTGPWPAMYKDPDGNPVNTYSADCTVVDSGDPETW